MNPLKALQLEGQSIWLDYIRRSLMTSGELNRLLEEDGLRGMTSNPTIFEKAINGSADYDESLRKLLEKDPQIEVKTLYEALAIEDIRMAADILRPVYDETNGADGYVSLEVSPRLANDTNGTIEEAKRLWAEVDRPNLMIKVPATPEGVPAFETLIASGVNVNCTLMFSLKHYEDIAQAYIRGLRHCDHPEKIASVASFFVSRVDTIVDDALTKIGSDEAMSLRGKAAVANAKLAYKRFQDIFHGDSFRDLSAKGCRVQRPLWASTSTKNPDYPDCIYVDELIGPDTVNTLPPATLEAFRDHGKPALSVTKNVDEAEAHFKAFEAVGVDLDELTDKLQTDGVAAFAKSFEELLEALKKKRSSILSSRSEGQFLDLGNYNRRVAARLDAWKSENYGRRLWDCDPTLWAEEAEPEITNRLGWLELPSQMRREVADLEKFRREIHRDSFDHAVLLGMGGSSLAPDVFQHTFGNRKGYPELIVLDSTHPAAVRDVEKRIDPAKTLFVVSSKSGTTVETLSFFKYFWKLTTETVETPGRHFVAITDPGTPLEDLAGECGFRRVFAAPADVGGRFSALSVFGMVPAALIGTNVHQLLDGAYGMAVASGPLVPPPFNPALRLGAAIGELAAAGRDKLTLLTSGSLASLPVWIEQLIAESTGKDGNGVLPVAGEAIGPPEVYGNDRFFVYLSNSKDKDAVNDGVDALEAAGHPVARIRIDGVWLLCQEFLRWEIATAAAGTVLGIQPFNQPDVELAKKLAAQRMAGNKDGGGVGEVDSVSSSHPELRERLAEFLDGAGPGIYVALQAYLAPSEATTRSLQAIRHALRDRYRSATTLGYGPRFLHSTGQLHKGGPDSGYFLQIVDADTGGLPVPETDYTFGRLIAAQADGDAAALLSRDRRVLRVVLEDRGLGALLEAVR